MKFETGSLVISLALIVSLGSLAVDRAYGNSVGSYFDGAKNYLVSLVKDGLISRSTLVSSFSETMEKIKLRYKQAKENGELEGKDEADASAFYYKIVIDEIRELKEKIAADAGGEAANVDGSKGVRKVKKPKHYDMMNDMDMDMDDEEDEELELMNELDSLEAQGPEMGWGLNTETKAALQMRTLQVLGDLVQNELKTLAMIIVTAYIGGPVAGAMGPAMKAANVSIKFKLIEFFMHSVMDMFAACLGQKVSPHMSNSLAIQGQTNPPAAGMTAPAVQQI